MRINAGLLAGASLVMVPVAAQAEDADGELPVAAPVAAALSAATVYMPADFDRYSPRNALDMLQQLPGFTIRDEGGQRGLGQASANVLIDGERVASKSDGLYDQLRRIALARVERVEIVDGATLGIPGLSGQVANVVTRPSPVSGRFEYRAMARPHYARPSWFGGEVSVSGSGEDHEWTLAYTHGAGRGGAGGGEAWIADATGQIVENREVVLYTVGDSPQLSASGKWTSDGGTVVNANASYSLDRVNFSNDELRLPLAGDAVYRDFDNRLRSWGYELGGDVEFGLAGGRLKLIGLERFEHERLRADSLFGPQGEAPDSGSRYTALTDSGERIGRAEYRWDMAGGSWQLDAEAAFNRLDREAALFDLDPSGQFVELPFPAGSGGVTEDRYEMILTHSRTLAPGLTLQLGAGAEHSTLAQSGPDGLTRRFLRPKGSANIAWSVRSGLDLSLKLERTVGQLSFGDFLARVYLDQENENAGNTQLVPPQSWDLQFEAKKDLGRWGSTTLLLTGKWYEDFIELIPVAGGLETRGNIPSARSYTLDWRSTFQLAPLGIEGARIDAAFVWRDMALTDPLTGVKRSFSGEADAAAEIIFRHDIPGSDWAWGFGAEYSHAQPYYRLGEVGREWEGPIYTHAFIEHKDVLGMTANLQVFNLTDGRARFERTVFDGYRDRSDVLFSEYRNLSVQPIVRLELSGDF